MSAERGVRVRPGNPMYSGYLLHALRAAGPLRYRGWTAGGFDVPGRLAAVLPDGFRVYFDGDDHPDIDRAALAWCDAYAMVNLDRALVPSTAQHKVLAAGPTFSIRPWSGAATLANGLRAVVADRELTRAGRRAQLGRYRRLQHQRLGLDAYAPGVSDPSYVFFASRRWGARAPALDGQRERFLTALGRTPGIELDGGLVDGGGYGLRDYLARTRRSALVLNTPAVHGCHGWKLGEFLALGKAIVTTPPLRDLPAPLVHGVHVHQVDGSVDAIAEAVERVLTDDSYRRRLETGARAYWEENLHPRVVLARIRSLDQPKRAAAARASDSAIDRALGASDG